MNILKKVFCRGYQLGFRVAMPILPYREPKLYSSIKELNDLFKELNTKSVLLVTDSVLRSTGVTKELESLLKKKKIKCVVYDKVCPNPTVHNVEEARELYGDNNCDLLIAFGGGSSMDCAKAVGARIAYPKKSVNKLKGLLRVLRRIPNLVAIPTTAGTGSEVTLTAVITDSEKKHKYTMNSFTLIPRYAVLDYKVTKTLPSSLTATTGMDALTHAVEAYIGGSTTKETRTLAIEATKLIFENILDAYNDGENIEARENMLQAAYKAGIAFSKSYVGYIHAVAHSLGGEYNIPHGLANAVLMPIVLEKYDKSVHKKLYKLGVSAGVIDSSYSVSEGAKLFISKIKELNSLMNIPTKLKGIRKEDISKMAKHASKEANPLYPVPKLMNAKELERIYYEVADFSECRTTDIDEILKKQKDYFYQGETHNVKFRIKMLKRLRKVIVEKEDKIVEALKSDLGKSKYESYMCEIGMVLNELTYMIKHTKKYAKEKKVHTPLAQFPSRSYVKPGPYGNVLIMSPWNYPFLLTIDPLVNAIAAGNTVVIKPSAYSPATSLIVKEIVEECFEEEYIAVVTGGRKENETLLDKKFDLIFFTGSQTVGKEVLRRASEKIIPVVLELGGKSPCIVDNTAKIKLAAKRIVFGKYLNCGQTCVAPDYIICDAKIKDKLVSEIKNQIQKQYGLEPLKNENYGHIINEKHFERLSGLINKKKVICGGKVNKDTLQIEPTVMDNITWKDKVMEDEIFGPILPILTYDDIEDVAKMLSNSPKPLALYIFSENKKNIKFITSRCSYGGGCVNDTIIHLATSEMGFGGVGESGMGTYHGKVGFESFSHLKSIVNKKTWLDLPMRYQPYKSKLYEKMLRFFLK